MPKGPKRQKRPADVIGAAVMVAKIATGEVEETQEKDVRAAKVKAGKKGAASRMASLSAKRRKEIASSAAKSRWEAPAQPEKKVQKEKSQK